MVLTTILKKNQMFKLRVISCFPLIVFLLSSFISCSQNTEMTVKEADITIIRDVLKKFSPYRDQKTGDLMIEIGKYFLGTPYVAQTLEINDEEKLVINLRELDCTTFAENCLALARAVKTSAPDENTFFTELKTIRYRKGILKKYPSRLHYFSDWIDDNEKKKIVKNITSSSGGIDKKLKLNFMSTHTDSYPALRDHPEFITEIAKQEKNISKQPFTYIPEKKLKKNEYLIMNGDIIGISTNIKGLDIMHVALAIRINGKLHILHASQSGGKVIISEETLTEYLKKNKKASGIVIARTN